MAKEKAKIDKKTIGKMVPNAVPKSQKKEKEREDSAWKKKLFGYLEGFKKSFAALEGGGKEKGKGLFGTLLGGLKGMLSKLLPKGWLAAIPGILGGLLGTIGIGVLLVGAFFAVWSAVKDAFAGYLKAKKGEWGNIDAVSGAIGAFFGGKGSGFWNAVVQGSKWAIMGATLGIFGGPPGILAGAIIGLALGAVAGWFGGEKIAQWIDDTVKKFRSIFDVPEAMSDEQKKLAEEEIAQAKKDLIKHADNLTAYRLELQNENTTYQRRIELRRMIAKAEKLVEEKKDIIRTESRRLAESQLGDMDKTIKEQRLTTQEAQLELQNATALKNQAYLKTIWAKAIHGEGSKEHTEAMAAYDDRVLAVKDAKQNLVDNQTKQATMRTERKALRVELDKEHRTAIGNVRLFFAGETDWQNSFKSGWKNMIGSIKTWFKDNIYDPGSTGGPPGTDTPLKIFGVEMKWPKLDFPTWQEIKDSMPPWLSTEWWSNKWDEWKIKLPTWAEMRAVIPWWLGGTKGKKEDLVPAEDDTGPEVEKEGWFTKPEWMTDWSFSKPGWMTDWSFSKPEWITDFKITTPQWITDFKIPEVALPDWMTKPITLPTWMSDFKMPEVSLPDWMTKPITLPTWMSEFELPTITLPDWMTTKITFDIPSWEDIRASVPRWLGGTSGTALDVEATTAFSKWSFTWPKWSDITSSLPTWLGGDSGKSTALQAASGFDKWTFTWPKWSDITASLPKWLGGSSGESTALQASSTFTKWSFTWPKWSDITASLPKWLGGEKEGKTLSELAEVTFGNWKIEFPTWDTIKKWLPDWITGPVKWIKGIFKKGDEASEAEEKARATARGRAEELKRQAKSRIVTTKESIAETETDLATAMDPSAVAEWRTGIKSQAGADRRAANQAFTFAEAEARKAKDALRKAEDKGEQNFEQLSALDDIRLEKYQLANEAKEARKLALEKINRQEQIDLENSQLDQTAEIKRLTDLQVALQTQLVADQKIEATDIDTLVKLASGRSLSVHDFGAEKPLESLVKQSVALEDFLTSGKLIVHDVFAEKPFRALVHHSVVLEDFLTKGKLKVHDVHTENMLESIKDYTDRLYKPISVLEDIKKPISGLEDMKIGLDGLKTGLEKVMIGDSLAVTLVDWRGAGGEFDAQQMLDPGVLEMPGMPGSTTGFGSLAASLAGGGATNRGAPATSGTVTTSGRTTPVEGQGAITRLKVGASGLAEVDYKGRRGKERDSSAGVAEKYATQFTGFVDELVGTGYKINSIGGWRESDIKGTDTASWHQSGMAIDINSKQNPMYKYGKGLPPGTKGAKPLGRKIDPEGPDTPENRRWIITDMPNDIADIARRHGMGWGGLWRDTIDAMHFSIGANEGGFDVATGKEVSKKQRGWIPASEGLLGFVRKPTLILAGEGGPEFVDIRPSTLTQQASSLKEAGATVVSATTINNVTVAPSTATNTSQTNISENTYGTVDPYTNASGAYG